MSKFILRVDDVGQAVNQREPDIGLEYFRRWWDAGGWDGLPVYLGVPPACLLVKDLNWLRNNNGMINYLCVHGWDHGNEVISARDLNLAIWNLPSPYLIPPYNLYTNQTLLDWKQAVYGSDDVYEAPVVFGGFNGEHHHHGEAPRIVDGVLHLSADRALYQHSYLVAQMTKIKIDYGTGDYPLVITLHHRWDEKFLNGVRRLRDLIADKLTTVEEAWEWARKNSSNYTSPANG